MLHGNKFQILNEETKEEAEIDNVNEEEIEGDSMQRDLIIVENTVEKEELSDAKEKEGELRAHSNVGQSEENEEVGEDNGERQKENRETASGEEQDI